MNDGFTIGINSVDLDRYLSMMIRRGTNLKPVFMYAKGIMMKSVSDNFRVGGRPKKWAGHSPATIAMRIRKGTYRGASSGGQPILIEYGRLRESCISPGSFGHYERTERYAFYMGTTLEYAKYHQHVPARDDDRPFLLFQNEDIRRITAFALSYSFSPNMFGGYYGS